MTRRLDLFFSQKDGTFSLSGVRVEYLGLYDDLGNSKKAVASESPTQLSGKSGMLSVILVFLEYALHNARRVADGTELPYLELVGEDGTLASSAHNILPKKGEWQSCFGFLKKGTETQYFLAKAIETAKRGKEFIVRLRREEKGYPYIGPSDIFVMLNDHLISDDSVALEELIAQLAPETQRWERRFSPIGQYPSHESRLDDRQQSQQPGQEVEIQCNTIDERPAVNANESVSVARASTGILWSEKSIDELNAAALAGDTEAQFILGRRYADGTGVKSSELEAVKWYRRAAEHGHAQAQYNLGLCFSHGRGVLKNLAEAEQWWRRSAEGGYHEGQYTIFMLLLQKEGHEAEAFQWLLRAAAVGNPKYSWFLASAYHLGEIVKRNDAESAKWGQLSLEQWHHIAVEQQSAEAEYEVGKRYETGFDVTYAGVEKDNTEAVRWYKKAVAQGYPPAEVDLGWCYLHGKGVNCNPLEAVQLFRSAAEKHYAKAYSALGKCFEDGMGVPQNRLEAIDWYRKAVNAGETMAKNALERLGG